ncbi:MAG: hypothetical protein OQK82_06540 [Candidatus Pacearchaeota archaeon]|nr:hypothetical protein [Candidatus Pacearchaeota archaeon]
MIYGLLPEQEYSPDEVFPDGISSKFKKVIDKTCLNKHMSYWGILSHDNKTVRLAYLHYFCEKEEIPVSSFFRGMAYAQREGLRLGKTYFPESFKDNFGKVDEIAVEILFFSQSSKDKRGFGGLNLKKIPYEFYNCSQSKLIKKLYDKAVNDFQNNIIRTAA